MLHIKKGIVGISAHVGVPEGTYEEEHGRDGFYGQVSHLYHKNSPTNWKNIEGDCRPVAFDTLKMKSDNNRVPFLKNADVVLSIMKKTTTDSFFFRNADGDDVYFVHAGSGEFETDYGPIPYEKGDYIVIPRGTTIRIQVKSPSFLLVIQATSVIQQPDRGLLGQHALYDPANIFIPEPKVYESKEKEYIVKIKRADSITSVTYGYHPLDVAGWKGTLFPWKLNIKEFRPVMSHRAHLAPSIHTTMVAHNFVICSFVPRPLEEDTDAQRVPFWHRNIDYDEVIFYHDGNFFSRDGISAGSVTFHPLGIHHGPHPKAYQNQRSKEKTDEYAVMIDARFPLELTEEAKSVAFEEYWKSWQF